MSQIYFIYPEFQQTQNQLDLKENKLLYDRLRTETSVQLQYYFST